MTYGVPNGSSINYGAIALRQSRISRRDRRCYQHHPAANPPIWYEQNRRASSGCYA